MLTAAQIVNLANQIAKTPGFTALAGQKLNAILQELCMTYDFEVAPPTKTHCLKFSHSPATGMGSGPLLLTTNELRRPLGQQCDIGASPPFILSAIGQFE